jgi:Resolvase, N terminal domain
MPAAGDALWISDGGKEAKDWRAIDRSGAADDPKAAAIFSQGYPVIAVIYARCSSGLQRDASIEDPIRLCRARFERDGWQYRHRYTDRVISGASALRSAYQSLLEDARRGQFDIVVRGARPAVISSPDRWIVHEVP